MLKFKYTLILIIWNKHFIELYCLAWWCYLISSLRNICDLSFVSFSLNCFYKNFLLDYISCVYNDFVCINFWVIFNNEFTLITTWDFSVVLKFKRIMVRMIQNKGFIINCVLKSKFSNNTFCCSFNGEFYIMNLFLSDFLIKCENLKFWFFSNTCDFILDNLSCCCILNFYQPIVCNLRLWLKIQGNIFCWLSRNYNVFFSFQ